MINIFGISDPAFWLGLAVILAIVEAATAGLITIWLVFGAIAAWVCALVGLPFLFQLFIFLIVSYFLLILTRPFIKKLLIHKVVKTNADRFIGQTGLVIEGINPVEGTGQVKVGGQIWSAIPVDGEGIEVGKKVEVTAITGVKLVVSQVENQKKEVGL
jgi:membrane protein implicated in regulation of membrane protease activity